MVDDDKTKINRPRQVYAGNTVRNIETLDEVLAMTV